MTKVRVYSRDDDTVADRLKRQADARIAAFAGGLPKLPRGALRDGIQTIAHGGVDEAKKAHRRAVESGLKALLAEAAREEATEWDESDAENL
jgi:hypothetical protein